MAESSSRFARQSSYCEPLQCSQSHFALQTAASFVAHPARSTTATSFQWAIQRFMNARLADFDRRQHRPRVDTRVTDRTEGPLLADRNSDRRTVCARPRAGEWRAPPSNAWDISKVSNH